MVELSSVDIPVTGHVSIYWTTAYVICMWYFHGGINYSQYFWSYTLLYNLKQYHPSNPLFQYQPL